MESFLVTFCHVRGCQSMRYWPGRQMHNQTMHDRHERKVLEMCKAGWRMQQGVEPRAGCNGARVEASS